MGNGNKIRVALQTAYQEQVTFKSGVQLYQDTRLNSELKTTVWGEVVHVPKHRSECGTVQAGGRCEICTTGVYCMHSDKGVQEDFKVGDKVCFRYDVINDGDLTENGRTHTNLIHIDGKPQWLVDFRQIFMRERDGVQTMVGDYVWCEPVIEELPKTTLVIPETAKDKAILSQLKVKSIGENDLGIQTGDKLLVRGEMVQTYNFSGIYGEDESVISKRHILAKIVD